MTDDSRVEKWTGPGKLQKGRKKRKRKENLARERTKEGGMMTATAQQLERGRWPWDSVSHSLFTKNATSITCVCV